MSTIAIDLDQLSPEQLQQLEKNLANKKKAEKEQRKENIVTLKKLHSEYVEKHINNLVNRHIDMEKIIEVLFKDYSDLKELKAEIYGVSVKSQDTHTSTLPDGSASITIGHNISIKFDGTENAGVEKIKNYLTSLSDDNDNDKTRKLIKMADTLLKRNQKTGMLNPSKIVELNSLRDEFNDEEFDNGLDIIINAQIRTQNSVFVSGWKYIELEDGRNKKVEFRFSV